MPMDPVSIIATAGSVTLRELVRRSGAEIGFELAQLVKKGFVQLNDLSASETKNQNIGVGAVNSFVQDAVSQAADPNVNVNRLAALLSEAAASPAADDIEITPTTRGWRGSVGVR